MKRFHSTLLAELILIYDIARTFHKSYCTYDGKSRPLQLTNPRQAKFSPSFFFLFNDSVPLNDEVTLKEQLCSTYDRLNVNDKSQNERISMRAN